MELADILNLRDAALPQQAREAHQQAVARVLAAQAGITDAEQAVATVTEARADLIRRAAGGETIDPKELTKAGRAITDAESGVALAREIHAAAEAIKVQAENDLRTVEGRAWDPVLKAGIALRIEGATDIVEAKRALADAEAMFAAGCEAVGRAQAGGCNLRFSFKPAANPELVHASLRPESPHPAQERETWKNHLDENGNVVLPEAARSLLEGIL